MNQKQLEALAKALAPIIKGLISEAVKEIPAPKDGSSVTAEDVLPELKEYIASLVKEIPAPKDGSSVTAEDVLPELKEYIASLVKEIPAPKDGSSVTAEDVLPELKEYIASLVKEIPAPKDGSSVTAEDVLPELKEYIASLVKEIPAPKDGSSVTAEDVLPELKEYIASLVKEIPAPKDGKDGVTPNVSEIAGHFERRFGELALSWDRQAREIFDKAVERMPKPKDAVSLDAFDLSLGEDGRTVTVRMNAGDEVLEKSLKIPCIIDRGIFGKSAERYEAGDGVTYGGCFWIAQKDNPEGTPGASSDWRLAVKKGRDGRDLRENASLLDKSKGVKI
jgi:hypothetical protein